MKEQINLTGEQVRETLSAAGFIPLVSILRAEHWVRASRRIVVHFETNLADGPKEQHDRERVEVLYANFVELESGEIILS